MHSVLQRHSDLTETKGIIYRYENDGRFYAKRRCIQDLRCPSTDVTAHRRAWNVLSEGASPFLFEPDMNWTTFSGANIIHDYWHQTVFLLVERSRARISPEQ